MDRNIGGGVSPLPIAGTTFWQRWTSLLSAQRAGLRLYQWLWLLFCIVSALALTAPRVFSRPVIYLSHAETHFDAARYGGLYANGQPSPDLQIALHDATEALRQRALARRELRFGLPDYRVEYELEQPGVIVAQGIAPTAAESQMLANVGAEELARQIRAAGGREVLRNLLGWETVAAMRGEPMTSKFEAHLRAIIEHEAFPMSRPIEPVSARINVENLPHEEQVDMARALEARYDLWTFEMNARNSLLDALCGTAAIQTTTEREASLVTCAASNSSVQQELEARNRVIQRRQTIEGALRSMLSEQGASFDPDQESAAYRQRATQPTAPEPRNIALFLALALCAGLLFGTFGVVIDRTAKVMPKLNELWLYRELIRNMVLRDLRTRYKSSALGYLWTQLAPLLMMLVFLFVFTLLMPSNVALYPVFLIVALLPWNYCAEAVGSSVRSVIDNAHLIKKIFFPREVLPLVSVFSSLVNYLLSLPMMFLVMAITQWLTLGRLNFTWTFTYLPVLILTETLFLIGIAFFLSALAVFFRDTVHLVGIVIQFWFFLTPVFYSLDSIQMPVARLIRWINPMASLIDFYREILYGNTVSIGMVPTPAIPALDSGFRVLVSTLIVLALGYWFFQRHSGQFGEEL